MSKNRKIPDAQQPVRLDKWLASSGFGSRKEVHRLLKEGRVTLRGERVTQGDLRLTSLESQCLAVDGQPVQPRLRILLMMNKAAGRITALEDTSLPTIAEDIPSIWRTRNLSPVGRLDRDTTGLLLLTNDGQLNHRLCAPNYKIPKVYRLRYEGAPFTLQDQERILSGIRLEDVQLAPGFLATDSFDFPDHHKDVLSSLDFSFVLKEKESLVPQEALLILTEGKFHEVKRIVQSLGRQVTQLHRVAVGSLTLDPDLEPGDCRLLSQEEEKNLLAAVSLGNLTE